MSKLQLLQTVICAFVFAVQVVAAPPAISIIPQPASMEARKGSFALTPQTSIVYLVSQKQLESTVQLIAGQLREGTGLALPVKALSAAPAKGAIVLRLVTDPKLGREGYALDATPSGVTIRSQSEAGLLYGAQSVLQLLPPQVFGTPGTKKVRWAIPAVAIVDTPRYAWRGMMLDVSRHFFPKEFVKRYIDYLVMHKMNTFHWHLTDDQGWRIEIKRYPLLTQVGAWRVDREDVAWNVRPPQGPTDRATYGGFYTQEEIKEVVAYAQTRHITVIPEIEMPAHVTAILAGYPQLSCTGGPFTVPPGGLWPIKDILCAGNDSSFEFVANVLTEVAGLFPSPYIHIGGDEANKTEWKRCPKCQARIKDEHLADEAELQSYFTRRVEGILKGLNKRLIGWDEILEGGLAPEATVMSWRGIKGGIEAARQHHDVIMAPTTNCYFDYYQADPSVERVAIGGYLPLENVYMFEPTPDSLTAEEGTHILGAQANLWAEYVPAPEKVEYSVFPRIAAIAEVVWSPKERRDWKSFTERLGTQLDRYAARGINAARTAYSVVMSDSFDTVTRTRFITLQSQIGQDEIRYTLNGKDPAAGGVKYRSPIALRKGTVIKAAVFINGRKMGATTTREYFINRPGIVITSLANPFDSKNPSKGLAELVDNQRGTIASQKNWMGLQKADFEAVVDLGSLTPVRRLTAGFLQNTQMRAFVPEEVVYSISTNGLDFRDVARVRAKTPAKEMRHLVEDFSAVISGAPQARFVKVRAANMGTCPDWHLAAGQPAWLAVDEIIVE